MTDSAISKVVVQLGTDGLAYYTAMYVNGEPGPRSEGYGSVEVERAADNIDRACRAAERDFPDLEVEVRA